MLGFRVKIRVKVRVGVRVRESSTSNTPERK